MPEQTKVINGRLHVMGEDGNYRQVPISMDEARDMKSRSMRDTSDLDAAAAQIEQAGQEAGPEYEA